MLPVEMLDFNPLLPGNLEDQEDQLDTVSKFSMPVVIDIGEGDKDVLITVEQRGRDGGRSRLLSTTT